MEDKIIERLKASEEKLRLYEKFRTNTSNPEADRKVVAFAYLYELMAYTAIHELVPDYIPSQSIQIQIAQALGGTKDHVRVVNGEVVVNSDYQKVINDLKNKQNGQVDKG